MAITGLFGYRSTVRGFANLVLTLTLALTLGDLFMADSMEDVICNQTTLLMSRVIWDRPMIYTQLLYC